MDQEIEFLRPENREFSDFWFGLLKHGLMPAKSEFNPRHITKFLPNIMLLELSPERELTFRLIGTAIATRRGDDLTNTKIEIPTDTDSLFLLTNLNTISQPCGFRSVMQEQYASGRTALVEIVGFPLCNEQGEPRFIIVLSQECSKEYSEVYGRNELSHMMTMDHEFIDIGAGTPEPVALTSTSEGTPSKGFTKRGPFKVFSKSA